MNHFIRRHLILLTVVLAILGVIYWLTENFLSVGIGGVILVVSHLLVATGILYLGGSRLVKFIQKLHEAPPTQTPLEEDHSASIQS